MKNEDQGEFLIVNTSQHALAVEWMKIENIKPYDRNAKEHSQAQIVNVAKSIEKYGWKQPIVVDSDSVIVIGHCRYLAAKSINLDYVPVIVANDLTREEAAELRIIDNKSNESPWDMDILAVELPGVDLSLFDYQFDLRDVSLTTTDLDENYIDDFFDRGVQTKEKAVVYAIRLTFQSEEELQKAMTALSGMGYSATRI